MRYIWSPERFSDLSKVTKSVIRQGGKPESLYFNLAMLFVILYILDVLLSCVMKEVFSANKT